MAEVLIAFVFLVLAAILGQWLMPRTTCVVTTATAHGFRVGDYIVMSGRRMRIDGMDRTTLTLSAREA